MAKQIEKVGPYIAREFENIVVPQRIDVTEDFIGVSSVEEEIQRIDERIAEHHSEINTRTIRITELEAEKIALATKKALILSLGVLPAPIVSLSVAGNEQQIVSVSGAEEVEIVWKTENIDSVLLEPFGNTELFGSLSHLFVSDTEVVLTATNSVENIVKTITVKVVVVK